MGSRLASLGGTKCKGEGTGRGEDGRGKGERQTLALSKELK